MKQPLKIGAYIRVSTDKQAQVFEGSLETQKFRMQEFVKLRNFGESKWGYIVDFYIDEGLSAATDRRPQYQRLLADIKNKRVDLILVADLARLSRSVRDFASLQADLEVIGASVFSMKEQFDTGTPSGRMMVNMMISMAQFEREQTSERVSINGHSRALRGFVNGGRPVLGFQRHPEKSGVLIVHKQEAEIVRTIFKVFLEEGRRSKTIERLHEMGIYPKRSIKQLKDNKPVKWTVQTLGNVLNQVAYIGLREVNRLYKHENQAQLKPWQQHQTVKASWGAIVEESDFLEAQRLLEEAAEGQRARLKGVEKKSFFLAHLLTCGECSRALVGQAAHGSGGVYRYYYHSRKCDDSECMRPRLHADLLEEKLIAHLRAGLTAAGYVKGLEKTIERTNNDIGNVNEVERDRLTKELDKIKKETDGIWRLQAVGRMDTKSLTLASDRLNSLAERRDAIEVRLAVIDREASSSASPFEQAQFVEDNLKDLLKGWSKATNSLKKRLLRRAIRRIVVTKEEMLITFWLSADQRDGAPKVGLLAEAKPQAEILEFRRRSRLADAQGVDQNLYVGSSLNRKNGSESQT